MMKGLFCFHMPFDCFFEGCLKKVYINSPLLFVYLFFDNLCVLCAALENSDGIFYG